MVSQPGQCRYRLSVETNSEALERIRIPCDHGIRYYTWALKRMPSIPEQSGEVPHVESLRFALAHVLAYVEGARDERQAQLRRDKIVKRCKRSVEEEGWEPPFSTTRY